MQHILSSWNNDACLPVGRGVVGIKLAEQFVVLDPTKKLSTMDLELNRTTRSDLEKKERHKETKAWVTRFVIGDEIFVTAGTQQDTTYPRDLIRLQYSIWWFEPCNRVNPINKKRVFTIRI